MTKPRLITARQPARVKTEFGPVSIEEESPAMTGSVPVRQITGADNVETVQVFYDLLSRTDIPRWAELWHEDGKILIPYPPDGFPALIEGKTAIVAGFRTLLSGFTTFRSTLTALYPAADSGAVCVEYRNQAVLANGTGYTNENIAVFRFTDGLIAEYHDYFDPRRFQVVVDTLDEASPG